MYEEAPFDPQIDYSDEALYTEQRYRLFPKEMYAGKFFGVELAKIILKHGGERKKV